MNRSKQLALAALAAISLGAGVLLYLAVALDASPGAGVLIALGAGTIAGCVPLIQALEQRSGTNECGRG